MNRQQKKVLIVEDETFTALMLEDYFRDKNFLSLGYSATAEEAIERARAEKPDLILMDFNLAGKMNGLEAAKAIEAELQTAVIIISGYTKDIVLEHADGYRPRAYIGKPILEGELDKALETL